jgi:hypothetical protein
MNNNMLRNLNVLIRPPLPVNDKIVLNIIAIMWLKKNCKVVQHRKC